MTDNLQNNIDPTKNVIELVTTSIKRLDDLREGEIKRIDHNLEVEIKRVDDKFQEVENNFKASDVKYQIQFNAAKEALGIALIAQEKDGAKGADSTKEAINKAEVATDKRFELFSDQIRALSEILNKNTGAQGIYVTHTDLAIFGEKLQNSFEEALKPLVSQVNSLTNAQNNQQGKSSGLNASWGILLGAVGLIGGLIGIFYAFAK